MHPSAKARGSIPSDSDQTNRICAYSISNDMRLLLSGKVSKLPKKEWGDIAFFEMNRVESSPEASSVLRFDLPSSAMLVVPESHGRAPFFTDGAEGSVSCINIHTSYLFFSLHVHRRELGMGTSVSNIVGRGQKY